MKAEHKTTPIGEMRRELMTWLNDDPLMTAAVIEADDDKVHELYQVMINLRKVGATRR